MNRRDTIVIAVLINMGLLVILFIGALKPSTPLELSKIRLHEGKEEKIPLPAIEEKRSLDPVDHLLSKYVEPQKETEIEPPKEVPSLSEIAAEPIPERIIVSPTPTKKVKEVIVRQGDVLAKIAKRHETSVEEIMKLNRLNDSRLQIGQILYVPVHDGVTGEIHEGFSSNEPTAKYYTVKNGDNPWTIAIKNGIKVEELLKLNNLDDAKAKKLKPGDKLRIR